MEKKNMSKEEEVVKRIKNMSIEEVNKLSKENRIIVFLIKSIGVINKVDIENIYLSLELNSRSKKFNSRVVERVLGEYNKWSIEKKEVVKSNLREELKRVNINYMSLVEEFKRIKKVMSSKKVSNFENKIKLEL